MTPASLPLPSGTAMNPADPDDRLFPRRPIVGASVAEKALGVMATSRTVARGAFPELTDREREVLDLVARGYDNATISRRLVLSQKTVRNHVSNVLGKLGAVDRAAAIVRAREAGLGV